MALSGQRASISTLSAHQGKYDVFLSFRGETRRTFTDHLFKALKDRGINVFRDHELERGIDLPSILSNAIKESKIAIIVLSPDYASSTWCLQELSKAFEQMKDWKTIQRIIPIFYNVEPSDVRRQRGTFDESFKKHEENLIEHKRLQQWRTALTDLSGITGWNSKDWNYETDFIAKIAEAVYNKLVCACCKMRIDDEELYFSCMGAVWHRECFRCNACNLPFTDNEFWKCGHHPYHKSCYKERFDVCKRFFLENSDGHTEYMEHLQKDCTGRASEESDAHIYGVVASEITTKDFFDEIKLSETLSAPVPVPEPEPETENVTSTKRDSGAREPGLRRFSDPYVAIATKNSPNEGKLGGGFGAVYRSLSAGLDIVAVKNISRGFKLKDNSFRLRNLLQVIGWFLLLYHLFMPNGILDFPLFGTSVLNCGTCFMCITLEFAHYFPKMWKQLVVHLSIKSSSIHRILLGSSFNFNFMRDGILYSRLLLKISSLLWATALRLFLGWTYTLLPECAGCLQQGVVPGSSKSNNILLDSIFNGKFMPNYTLDSQAFFGKRSLLDYTVRPFISIGSAYALFYLHQMWKQFMVQRNNTFNTFGGMNCICWLQSDGFGYQSYLLIESTLDGTLASDLFVQIYPWPSRAASYIIFSECAYTRFYVLKFCWKQFVVHRDNVLLDSSSNVKVIPNDILDSLLYRERSALLCCACTCILYMRLTSGVSLVILIVYCWLILLRWETISFLSRWYLPRWLTREMHHEQGPKRTEKRSVSRMRKDSKRVQLEEWVSKLDGQGRLLSVLAAEKLLMMIQCHLQIRIRIHQPHPRIPIQAHSL